MLCLKSWASLIAHLVKNLPAMQETPVQFLGWEDCWRRGRLPTPVFLGFPRDSASKECVCNGDLGSIPELGRSLGDGKGYPLQYSGLKNSMDCIVHGVTKSQAQLSNFHCHFMESDCLSSNLLSHWWIESLTSVLDHLYIYTLSIVSVWGGNMY